MDEVGVEVTDFLHNSIKLSFFLYLSQPSSIRGVPFWWILPELSLKFCQIFYEKNTKCFLFRQYFIELKLFNLQ